DQGVVHAARIVAPSGAAPRKHSEARPPATAQPPRNVACPFTWNRVPAGLWPFLAQAIPSTSGGAAKAGEATHSAAAAATRPAVRRFILQVVREGSPDSFRRR